ncbi:MAG: hypothetical protein MJ203_05945 [archaeon]|nr:hypothetical protein [archaeon]
MKKIKFIAPLVATSALAMSVLPMVSCEDDPVPVDTTADVYAVNINKSTHSDVTITQSTDDVTVGENLDIKIDFVGLAQTTYYS